MPRPFATFLVALLLASACNRCSSSRPTPAATPRTPAATDPMLAPPTTTPMKLGGPLDGRALALGFSRLERGVEREGLVVVPSEPDAFQLVVAAGATGARMATLTRAFGVTPEPTTAPTTSVRPVLVAVPGGAPLRAEPVITSDAIRALPPGALAVALLGDLPSGASTLEAADGWVLLLDAAGARGFVEARQARLETGCGLSIETVAASLQLPESDPRLANPLVGTLELKRGGIAKPGAFAFTDGFVALFERGADCGTTLDTRIETASRPLEYRLRNATFAGDTFVALGFAPLEGTKEHRWSFYPPRASTTTFEFPLATDAALPARERAELEFEVRSGPQGQPGFWAFTIRPPRADKRFYASDGTSFMQLGATLPWDPASVAAE